jgi:hypothetical protein
MSKKPEKSPLPPSTYQSRATGGQKTVVLALAS